MAVASLSRIQQRVIELLLAAGRGARYTSTVGDSGLYAVTQEVTDAIIEADMRFCEAVISTPGHPYRPSFMVASSNLASSESIPPHVGAHGKVLIDPTGAGAFKRGILADSMDEVAEVLHHPTLYPNCKLYYFIEDSVIEHTGSAARVYYPSFTKNDAACQSHELYTEGVACAAIAILEKKGGDTQFYRDYRDMAAVAEMKARGRAEVIPEIEQLRLELAGFRKAA
jgi:hypothetical protein